MFSIENSIFWQYQSRNTFQDIFWNLHVANSTNNPPLSMQNHDPLAKVRSLLQMCQDHFKLIYTSSSFLSIDESMLPFKGLVKFLQFCKAKPNKFFMKLFMVSEHSTGYICGFSVYIRKSAN